MMYGYIPVITPSLHNFAYSTPVACGSSERDRFNVAAVYIYVLRSTLWNFVCYSSINDLASL